MFSRRRLVVVARLALVWLAAALTVAVAAPLVQPRLMQPVCSVDGGVRWQAGDASAPAGVGHALDCVLCLSAGAPPAVLVRVDARAIVADAGQAWSRVDAPVAAVRHRPLPPRGPPRLA